MSQRDVREGGYCYYTPDEDFRLPLRIGKQVFIYGWPVAGACFDTLDEALEWMAHKPLSEFVHYRGGDFRKEPDWVHYDDMECIIDPVATVSRITPDTGGRLLPGVMRIGAKEALPLKMAQVGWVGRVTECRQLRQGERDRMGNERMRRGRGFLTAMKGVSRIMDKAPSIKIPRDVTNLSWRAH